MIIAYFAFPFGRLIHSKQKQRFSAILEQYHTFATVLLTKKLTLTIIVFYDIIQEQFLNCRHFRLSQTKISKAVPNTGLDLLTT